MSKKYSIPERPQPRKFRQSPSGPPIKGAEDESFENQNLGYAQFAEIGSIVLKFLIFIIAAFTVYVIIK